MIGGLHHPTSIPTANFSALPNINARSPTRLLGAARDKRGWRLSVSTTIAANSFLFNATLANGPALTDWLLLAPRLHYFSVFGSKAKRVEQISQERGTPMKVKTNTKAGNALWGS